jgi:hypothetical protein
MDGLHDKMTSLQNEERIRVNCQLSNVRLQFDCCKRQGYVSTFAALMTLGFDHINVGFAKRDSENIISSSMTFFRYPNYVTFDFSINSHFHYWYENVITIEKYYKSK